MSKILGKGMSGSSRIREYRGDYSRSIIYLEMAYRGLIGQGESLEYEYSG